MVTVVKKYRWDHGSVNPRLDFFPEQRYAFKTKMPSLRVVKQLLEFQIRNGIWGTCETRNDVAGCVESTNDARVHALPLS